MTVFLPWNNVGEPNLKRVGVQIRIISQYKSGICGTQENSYGNKNIFCTHKGLGALRYNQS